jgi:uncharacterized membrane protein YgaE (UPF0421/DUF939 family)
VSEETKSSSGVLGRIQSLLNGPVLGNPARTTVSAVVSFFVARLFRLPESYWAVVSTIVVLQSTLKTSLPVAWRRLAGTALGAVAGGLIGSFFEPGIWVFATGLFLLGLISALLGRANKQLQVALDKTTYRYAGITLTITILVPRSGPIWIVAAHRFCEVSIGIAVALAMTWLWPERQRELTRDK